MSVDRGGRDRAAWTATWRRHATAASCRLAVTLYPRLRERPAAEWRSLLRQARDEPLEGWETGAIVAGVVFATWLLRVEPSILAGHSVAIVAIVQFVLALPVLAVAVGPVHVRRTRRGLAALLGERAPVSKSAILLPEANPHSSRKET